MNGYIARMAQARVISLPTIGYTGVTLSGNRLKTEFIDILQPLGAQADDFFLAASLYHSQKVSFAAAGLAGLSLDEFNYRLKEHFGHGFLMADETVEEDLATVRQLRDRAP